MILNCVNCLGLVSVTSETTESVLLTFSVPKSQLRPLSLSNLKLSRTMLEPENTKYIFYEIVFKFMNNLITERFG